MDDDKILVKAINSCPLQGTMECQAEPCRLCRKAAARIERLRADVARPEAESRAKEQYIAEHMGGTAERNARMKRDAERLRGTTAHANSDDGILIEEEYK